MEATEGATQRLVVPECTKYALVPYAQAVFFGAISMWIALGIPAAVVLGAELVLGLSLGLVLSLVDSLFRLWLKYYGCYLCRYAEFWLYWLSRYFAVFATLGCL